MKPPKFWLKRDPQTDEEWEAKARFLGVESGAVLKAQTKLADELLLEVIEEEAEDLKGTP
jgi:hypothetical protein